MTKEPPNFLQQLSTDEYAPAPHSRVDSQVISRTGAMLKAAMARYRLRPQQLHQASATAAGLLALNEEYGHRYYEVDPDAVVDDSTAAAAFASEALVIDVQTHFMAPHGMRALPREALQDMYRATMPRWWTEMDDIVQLDLATYVTNVFLESEVAVAVLTSGPGLDDSRNLFNDELAATRALVDSFAGSGRLLQHSVVHADLPEEVAAMPDWARRFKPAAWKVYTPGRIGPDGWLGGWMLDDEEFGYPFLEKARSTGVRRICAHKGISLIADNGSPRDIGPAAKAFSDLEFIIYHSGFEFTHHGSPPEGPYSEATADVGINRLIHSCLGAGIGPGANVYAELGSTWFAVIRRPVEAAHVIGKMLRYFGEDNVLWGSDSIWYGSQQPLINALRSFQIPDEMCRRYGYSKLTPAVKDKILGGNAARVYGIDLDAIRPAVMSDDLAWAKLLLEDYRKNGFAALR
jgi:predicted TIM-barrel fold metal-dependent hydrolase